MRINYEMRTRNIFRGDIFVWTVSGHGENEFMGKMKNKLKIEHLDLRISTTDVICFLFTKKIIPHKCSRLFYSYLLEVQFGSALFTKDTHARFETLVVKIFFHTLLLYLAVDPRTSERTNAWMNKRKNEAKYGNENNEMSSIKCFIRAKWLLYQS